jgi:hypothetical protein
MSSRPSATAIAFMVTGFAIVGLTGVFAAFAAQLPLQRALVRETTLDAALATQNDPQPQAALEALRPALDDSADAVIGGPGPLAARVAQERAAMQARMLHEADALSRRLQWMVGVATVTGALFGVAMMGIGRHHT